ncbi:MAG: hypothetical protein Q7U34_08660 [Anaerolineales bacterium]|nr:hypothetical protein [Anaerolineales bacterium]MDP3183863.1 hypothetical protein [Anaerolineales bacterium]
MKDLLKQAMFELFDEHRDVFSSIMAEAIKEVGLATAIREGRKNEFVNKYEIAAILAM